MIIVYCRVAHIIAEPLDRHRLLAIPVFSPSRSDMLLGGIQTSIAIATSAHQQASCLEEHARERRPGSRLGRLKARQ